MKRYLHLLLWISIIAFLEGCTIDSFENNQSLLTDEELRITGQIIGESVSENESGILSSFTEAFAIPTTNGLATGNSLLSTGSFRNLQDYTYSYDDSDGTHLVQFNRTNAATGISTEYDLRYIFRDSAGNIISSPNQDSHLIESLEFVGRRTGQIDTPTKSSVYNRTDRFILDGISDQTSTLTLEGSHAGEGQYTRNEPNNTLEREYLLDINFLNVRINKDIVEQNRSFRKGVNGAVSYESTIRSSQNGNDDGAKIVNGTLNFNGDGTALLKFQQAINSYRIRLENGEVFDDDEFEGIVTEVNTGDQTFTISNGQIIQINEKTEFENDDDSRYRSLEDVATALDNGLRVAAEGDYYRPDDNVNLWIATEVEFENEENEFEEFVLSLNLADSTITLLSNELFYFTSKTDIEFEDGFESLQDVQEALESNLPVYAEGDFIIESETGRYLITEIDLELELDEFEELVQSVDVVNRVITLTTGRQILFTEETIIEDDGDYLSLEEVSQALDDGVDVEADGDYYYSSANAMWIALNVQFDAESDTEED